MKKIQLGFIAVLCSIYSFAQTNPCGTIINDTFDEAGALPSEWTEYNTTGSVTIADGKLKFEHSTAQPSAYRTFTAISNNVTLSFDVSASRSYASCQVNLISDAGEYLSTIDVGSKSASIQYATTIVAGVPSGFTHGSPEVVLQTNTFYSINATINFTTKTIDYYANGVLMAANVPFLESATNIAKVDIQSLFMYSDNGQFLFDTISFLSADENRLNLMSSVSISETLLSTAPIGVNYGQYPQAAVDTFQGVLNDANTVLANCEATSTAIDKALADLEAAKVVFKTSKKDDPVLKIYSDYNFSGDKHEIYCGFYNGTLAAYDNWAVSFTLDKGYMVTFAENINGTGVSKVYIASEENLRINLPLNLQKNISFIRVSPWRDVHKKGLAGGGTDIAIALNNSWYYNWSNTGENLGEIEFVPNQWSGGSIEKSVSLGERMDITHHMAFNEPDNDDQSNMAVDKAIEKYELLLASGLRLGSPANTDGAKGATWRNEFMEKAVEKGLRVDYIVVHYYKKSTPAVFYNWLKAIHDKWQRPIWIKEFNYGAPWVSNKPADIQDASDGLESYLKMMDETSFVERYSVYTWQPDSERFSFFTVRRPIELSISGIMYRDYVSPVAYTQEVYEQGVNLAVTSFDTSNVGIYPNPVTNQLLTINYTDPSLFTNAVIKIYNVLGKEVLKKTNVSNQMDVSGLSDGIYLVQIIAGDVQVTKKIIITNQQ